MPQFSWTRYTFRPPETIEVDQYRFYRRDPDAVRAAIRHAAWQDLTAHLRDQAVLVVGGVIAIVLIVIFPEPPTGWWEVPWTVTLLFAAVAPLSFGLSTISFTIYLLHRRIYVHRLLSAARVASTYPEFLQSAQARGVLDTSRTDLPGARPQ
jgi:hypothetical protein